MGERSLSSGVLLQTALKEHCTTPPPTWSRLHSLNTGTLIHPLFLLQGRDAAPSPPLPHAASLCSTQMNVYAHSLTQWPFSVFYTASMLQCGSGQWLSSMRQLCDVSRDVYSALWQSLHLCVRLLPWLSDGVYGQLKIFIPKKTLSR